MQTTISHIQLNVRPANVPFYRDLMAFLGWQTIYDAEGMLGVGGSGGYSLWFLSQTKDAKNDYDGPGMNHLGIGAATAADVDAVATYLRERGVDLLFDTPRRRPEISQGDEHTYYQVMFETRMKILLEVVYRARILVTACRAPRLARLAGARQAREGGQGDDRYNLANGWTTPANADTYKSLLRSEIFVGIENRPDRGVSRDPALPTGSRR